MADLARARNSIFAFYSNCDLQLELVIEQKDSNYSHKKKLLESQLSLLRDQLEAERRRRQNGSGRFERSTDVRMSRTTAVRKDSKGPFRV